jgi:hypothetical protein
MFAAQQAAALPGGVIAVAKNSHLSGNLVNMLHRIVREEGVLSLWKGNLMSVVHRFPYSAINFFAFDTTTKLSHRLGYKDSIVTRFLCGATAGGVACMACYPLDLVKIRLMATRDTDAVPGQASGVGRRSSVMGIYNTMSRIVLDEGIGGLYRGLFVSLAVTLPTFGISFSVYGTVKSHILEMKRDQAPFPLSLLKDATTGHLSPYGSMLCGAISGVTSSLLLFPADVVRRRVQVAGLLRPPTNPSLSSVSSCSSSSSSRTMMQTIGGERSIVALANNRQCVAVGEIVRMLRADGIRPLYRGIVPEVLKIAPMVSITFGVYEYVMDLIESDG